MNLSIQQLFVTAKIIQLACDDLEGNGVTQISVRSTLTVVRLWRRIKENVPSFLFHCGFLIAFIVAAVPSSKLIAGSRTLDIIIIIEVMEEVGL